MFEELNKLLANSKSQLTNFAVSSIIVDVNGNEYKGVNAEFATLAPSLCAERSAIANAITNGMKIGELKEVHILSRNNNEDRNDIDMFITPCGVCRQSILEQSKGVAMVHCYNQKGEIMIKSISELLPFSFTGEEI
jgi:cytidine deaminase